MNDSETRRDAAYRAIGRYFVEFSLLVLLMRNAVVMRIARGSDDDWIEKSKLAELAIGEQSAQPIADSFFATCRFLGRLDKEEREIEKALRLAVNEEIKRRNLIAHGDWLVMHTQSDEPENAIAALSRIRPSSIKEPKSRRSLTVAELERFGDEVYSLSHQAAIFGAGSLGFGAPQADEGEHRVSEMLALRDGRVVFR